jgi:Protein of unknown function (DUF4232)
MINHAHITALAGAAAFAALTCGTAVLASQAVSTGTPGSAASSRTPRCTARQISAGLHGAEAGVSNHAFILTLTNTSKGSCSVDGYAGLKLKNAAHHPVHSSTHGGGTYFAPDLGPHLIVLSPGETASADFAFVNGTGSSSDSVATYLLIAPPGTSRYLTAWLPGAPVPVYRGNLFVTAMARHTPFI